MGRVAGILAGIVGFARLVVDGLLVLRDLRRDAAQAEPGRAPAVGRQTEAQAPGRVDGLGHPGPPAGPDEG